MLKIEENKQLLAEIFGFFLKRKKDQLKRLNSVDLPFPYRENTLCNNNTNNNQRVEGLNTKIHHISNDDTDYRQEPLTQTRLSGGRQKEGPARKEQAGSFPLTCMEKVLGFNTKDSTTQTIQKSMLWHKKPLNPLISVGFLAGLFEGKRSECIQINLTRRIDGC